MDNQDLEIQAQSSPEVAGPMTNEAALSVGERLSKRNFIMFPLGTFGRDFLYNFFNGFLLSFVLLTKTLDTAQFSMITVIIICARIFDAFNDPIMGSIVENTRTRWGKYKPWQLIGAVLTGGVIIALFNVSLDGWAFIGFLAFAYFMFSITFTMNDISYWGMMPSLTSNPDDRNKLTSFTQLVCSAGGGLAGLLVPLFTVGDIAQGLGLGAVNGYRLISIIVVVLMVGFQLFTILGVKEKPLPANFEKTERTKLKDLFKVLFHNDQLLWCTLVMLIWNLISGIAVGNILTFYIYFEFGYEGMLGTVFSIVYAVLSVIFTLFYPWFSKKLGRNRTLYSCGITLIISYALLLIVGLAWPNSVGGGFDIMGMHITPKFLVMALLYGFTGWSTGFYMIMLINMANTVEYNEWKTGKRDEAIIFSLRPFTAKMGSALTQGVVSLVLIIAGALTYTNKISELENLGTQTGQNMSEDLRALVATVDEPTKMKLLACMCIIPMVLMAIALIIYKAKCKLDEPTLARMIEETEARKAEQEAADEEAYEEAAAEIDGVVTTDEEAAASLLVGKEADEKIEDISELDVEDEASETYPQTSDTAQQQPAETEDETSETAEEQPIGEEAPEEAQAEPSDEETPTEETPTAKEEAAFEQEQEDGDTPDEEQTQPAEDENAAADVAYETPQEATTASDEANEPLAADVEEDEAEGPIAASEEATDVEEDEDEEDEDDLDDEGGDAPAADDGTPRYVLTYLAKLIQAPDEVKAYYSAVKNIFLSYRGIDTRVTRAHESIFLGRVKLAKFVMRGKSLELQLALTTRDINKSKYAIEKLDKKGDYTCRYKLNGTRRVEYVGELVKMLMKSKGIEPATRHKDRDFAAELPYEEIEALVEKGLAKVKK